ncbi:hypothetical protein R6Q59_005861 [Mikania micrantha]
MHIPIQHLRIRRSPHVHTPCESLHWNASYTFTTLVNLNMHITNSTSRFEITTVHTPCESLHGIASYTFTHLLRVENEMIKDGTYFEGNVDPLVKVLGPEHGGRSRTVSHVIGATKVRGGLFKGTKHRTKTDVNRERVHVQKVDESHVPRGSSYVSCGRRINYPPIEKITSCDLLFPFQPSLELVVARGQAWPSLDRILHGKLINEDCVKIQVDIIIEGCEKMPVTDVTRTDEIMFIGDMLHHFIQWPRESLKLVNNEALSTSSPIQMGLTRNVSSPCSSHRGHSPQIHNSDNSSSSYHPIEDEGFDSIAPLVSPQYELGPMSFINMLIQMEPNEPQNLHLPEVPSINAQEPEPKFIDPEINISLEKIKKRPLSIRSIVEVLSTYVGDEYAITYSSPNGMYDKTYVQGLSYGELLHLFCNEWLDISVVHLFTMYFYELSNFKCAFFNPHDITGDVCIKNPNHAKDHILEMYSFHSDKTFFVAPYIASGHWLLFIIYPLKQQG